jgi:hypothetical protein
VADLRISELNSLASADVASNDFLPIADRSASETKKVTVVDFLNKAVTQLSDDVIPSAKILFDSQTIPGGAFVNGAVGSDQIASNAVDSTKLANNSSAQLVTSLPATGVFAGQLAVETETNKAYVWDGSSWVSFKAAGSINQLVATTAGPIRISVSTVGDTATLSVNPQVTPSGGIFLAGPAGSGGEVSGRQIVGSDLPTATNTAKGAVIVNGEGLRVDGETLELNNDVTATNTFSVVTHDAKGLVNGSRAVTSADLPNATASATGAVQPGTGLSVTNAGVLNHTNAVTAGTATKITFDAQGHVTNGGTLTEDDIPDIPAEKLTSGVLASAVFGTNTVPGSAIADQAVTQFGGPGSTAQVTIFPNADFKGQFFYDVSRGDLYLWEGAIWTPVTVTSGELVFAGIYDAAADNIGSVSAAGAGLGLAPGDALPAPSSQNNQYYFVVENIGTSSATYVPSVELQAPDQLLSDGQSATWQLIDISGTITGNTAGNITFTPFSLIQATDVQAAVEEVYNESVRTTGATITGTLEIGATGSFKFDGTTANSNKTTLTVADPTANRTITLPNVSGTVVTTGDTGTVTNTMLVGSIAYSKLSLTGSILNADINASAGITYSKLSLSNSIVNGDIATGAAIAYSKLNLTGNITNADINAGAAIAKSKLNLTGTITNTDINANAAIADTKLNTITTAGKVSGSAITSGTIGGSTAISTTGNISTTGTLSDGIGPVRSIPRNSQSAAYTLQASDSGKFIRVTNGVNITITQSITPAFQIGDNVTIYNDSSTSTIQIIQGANATLVTGGQTTTGTRTLATNGVATLLCVDTNKFVITGTGIT